MAPLSPNTLAASIAESATLAMSAKAATLRAAGRDVVSLSAGEPDFATPESVAEAGIEAIRQGQTRYTQAAGIPELRLAGAEWFKRKFGLDYSPDEVMVTAGAKAALHMALTTALEPGERVLILAPYWVSYPDLIKVAGGVPVEVPAVPEKGFIHTGAEIEAAARKSDARGLMLNFPNNPSGASPTGQQVEEIVNAAVNCGMWIISDEIYSTMLYDGAEHVSPAAVKGGRDRVLVVNGGTKSHSLTGWRIGFLAGPVDLIDAASRIQGNVLGNPCTISQAASLAAFTLPLEDELENRMASFDERRRYLVEAINAIPTLRVSLPAATFYAMVDVSELCDRLGCDDARLCERLLDEMLLAVVPGSAFALPGYIRLSYAAALQELRTAVERLAQFEEKTR
jgi:aspartate aminotransferase